MPTIHLIHGYMGFGKTTFAKQLEKELPAIRFTHDEIMLERFGRTPQDFETKAKEVDTFIRLQTAKAIHRGHDVILDYGFWEQEKRQEYYNWAQTLTPNVIFHAFKCNLQIAKQRVITRSQNNPDELNIDASIFDKFLYRYEPMTKSEGIPVIFHQTTILHSFSNQSLTL